MKPGRAARPAASPSAERLAIDLLGRDPSDPVARELLEWLADAPRFRSFAEVHRGKIRKKLRHATGAESLTDVRAELQAARLLLVDRRFELAFEAYGSGKSGPDFTVTNRGTTTFNVEVTRLHRVPDATRFGESLLAKLRQLPPSLPNMLVVAIDGDTSEAVDVAATTRALRASADAKDEEFFARHGFEGTREFYERYLRLAAVIVWCEGASGDARATIWRNGSARIAVPERAARACVESFRGDP